MKLNEVAVNRPEQSFESSPPSISLNDKASFRSFSVSQDPYSSANYLTDELMFNKTQSMFGQINFRSDHSGHVSESSSISSYGTSLSSEHSYEPPLFNGHMDIASDLPLSPPISDPSPMQQPSNEPLYVNPLLTPSGEHPLGEHPSRTLFVRNINSNAEDTEIISLFEEWGEIRSMYTQCKHRGFVMVSYYDIRHAKNAMRHLQGKLLRRRKLDIHYSIPKDNPSEKDQNQGTLVVFNLDSSLDNDDLKKIFGQHGEIKEIRETPNKKHHRFIEFYDVRCADRAMKFLNKTEIRGKKIKIEPSRPGGSRAKSTKEASLTTADPVLQTQNSDLTQSQQPIGTLPLEAHNPVAPSSDFSYENLGLYLSPLLEEDSRSDLAFFQDKESLSPTSAVPSLFQSPPETNGAPYPPSQSPPALFSDSLQSSNSQNTHELSSTLLFQNPAPLRQGSGQLMSPSLPQISEPTNPSFFQQSEMTNPSCLIQRSESADSSPFFQPHEPIGSFSSSSSSAPSSSLLAKSYSSDHAALSTNCGSNAIKTPIHPSFSRQQQQQQQQRQQQIPLDLQVPSHPALQTSAQLAKPPHQPSQNGLWDFAAPVCQKKKPSSPLAPSTSAYSNSNQRQYNHEAEKPLPKVNNNNSSNNNNNSQFAPNQFTISLTRVLSNEDQRTTLMIRNIPNKYSQKMLLAAVDEKYKGYYDFFYLPIDFKNKCNVGYAFINFSNTLPIPSFFYEYHGKRWEKFNSEKVCQIAYARIQGKTALINHFQNSPLLLEEKKCRPIIINH